MSAQSKIALFAAAAILSACATAQENPHYQHSTKYNGTVPAASAPGTAYASNTNTQTRQVVYQQSQQSQNYATASYGTTSYEEPSYSRVSAACIEQGLQNTASCAPSSVAINGQSASVATPYVGNPQTLYVTHSTRTTANSPTEDSMPESYGTPGYEAMRNAETSWEYDRQQTPEWTAVEAPANAAIVPGVSVPVTQPFASALPAPSMRQAMSPDMMPRNEQSYTLGSQHEIQQGDTVYSFARSLCSSVAEIQAMNSLDGNFSIRLGDTIRLPASKC